MMSVAPGIGTAIPVPVATPRAYSIPISLMRRYNKIGIGQNATQLSQKFSATPSMWRTDLI